MWTWMDTNKMKSDEEDQTLTSLSACIKKNDQLEKTLAQQSKTDNTDTKHQNKKSKGTKFLSLRHKNPPKEGHSEEFTYVDGKVVYYCKTHGWNMSHTTADCRGIKKNQDTDTDSEIADTSKKSIIAGLSNIPIIKKT